MNNDDKRRYLILKDPNIAKGLFILSLPIMLNNFIRTFHDLIDMFFVGKIAGYGEQSIAAIQITFPITFMYIALAMGLSIAGTALISQLYGNGQTEQAKRYAGQLVFISLAVGIILNIFAYFAAEPIMGLMGAEGYTLAESAKYLRIRSFELPFLFLFFAFTSIRQASGDTVTPVILGVVATVLNIALTPVLVLIAGWGVGGAAYATLFANVAIMPFGIRLLFTAKTGITISLKYISYNAKILKDLVKTAIPASMGQAITAIGFAVLNAFILSYGDSTVAAFGVGNRISSIFLHPVMAIGGVMAAYIGQNIGNLNPERAKKTFKVGLLLSMGIMTLGSIVGLLVRQPVAALFLNPNDVTEVVAYNLSVTYMFYLFIGLPLMAIFQAYIGVFNGTGKTIFTFLLGVTRLWLIRIPLIIIMREFTDLGSSGIWYAMLASNFIIALVGIVFLTRIEYKPKIEIEPILS
ncbi:Multidrug export protein MepA [Candidatus Izimaplasma bacterium HR1]|jgi:putative MATE family efflux protein|uniref:MATE family efflux transporter n=1 Tax=Candidatus Izimoplasma sp. HR1 TaxID=1541959 RepID=UPI0004F7A3C1|nr:Multidrug export protein MepA [Candidatus Izimaplasma bacterium HR1]